MRPDDTQKIPTDRTQQLPRTVAIRQTRRVVVAVVGGSVLLIGVALALPGVPGPGLLIMILGLTILSWEFAWARRMLVRARLKWKQLRQRARRR